MRQRGGGGGGTGGGGGVEGAGLCTMISDALYTAVALLV